MPQREREREILKGEGGKNTLGGFSGGEITQMSLKASLTVFSLCILGDTRTNRETDGHRGSGGCRGRQGKCQVSKTEQMSGVEEHRGSPNAR